MSYKLLKEEKTHFLVRHPSGREFKVAKRGIDKAMHERIRSYAEGTPDGPIPDPGSATSPEDDIINTASLKIPASVASVSIPSTSAPSADPNAKYASAYQDQLSQISQNNPGLPQSEKERMALDATGRYKAADQLEGQRAANTAQQSISDAIALNTKRQEVGLPPLPLPGPAGASSPDQSDQVRTTASIPASAEVKPSGSGGSPFSLFGGSTNTDALSKQLGLSPIFDANMKAAKVQQDYWNDVADSYHKVNAGAATIEDQNKVLQAQQDEANKALQESDAAMNDLKQNGKIDPMRYWHNLSTGQKVLAGIATFFGGAAAAWSRNGVNPALQTIQSYIDKDISAQEQNISTKKSLLSMNMQKYGDYSRAVAMTRMQMAQTVQNKINELAAKSNSRTAIPMAQSMNAQLKAQYVIPQAMAFGKAAVEAQVNGANGSGAGVSPQTYEQMSASPMYKDFTEKMVFLPDKNRYFSVSGSARPEEVESLKNFEIQAGQVKGMLDQLKQVSQSPSVMVPGTKEYQLADTIRQQLSERAPLMFSSEIGSKRIPESSREAFLEAIGNPSSFKQAMSPGTKQSNVLQNVLSGIEMTRQEKLHGYKPDAARGFSGIK